MVGIDPDFEYRVAGFDLHAPASEIERLFKVGSFCERTRRKANADKTGNRTFSGAGLRVRPFLSPPTRLLAIRASVA